MRQNRAETQRQAEEFLFWAKLAIVVLYFIAPNLLLLLGIILLIIVALATHP